jgi:hypothetical protein
VGGARCRFDGVRCDGDDAGEGDADLTVGHLLEGELHAFARFGRSEPLDVGAMHVRR